MNGNITQKGLDHVLIIQQHRSQADLYKGPVDVVRQVLLGVFQYSSAY